MNYCIVQNPMMADLFSKASSNPDMMQQLQQLMQNNNQGKKEFHKIEDIKQILKLGSASDILTAFSTENTQITWNNLNDTTKKELEDILKKRNIQDGKIKSIDLISYINEMSGTRDLINESARAATRREDIFLKTTAGLEKKSRRNIIIKIADAAGIDVTNPMKMFSKVMGVVKGGKKEDKTSLKTNEQEISQLMPGTSIITMAFTAAQFLGPGMLPIILGMSILSGIKKILTGDFTQVGSSAQILSDKSFITTHIKKEDNLEYCNAKECDDIIASGESLMYYELILHDSKTSKNIKIKYHNFKKQCANLLEEFSEHPLISISKVVLKGLKEFCIGLKESSTKSVQHIKEGYKKFASQFNTLQNITQESHIQIPQIQEVDSDDITKEIVIEEAGKSILNGTIANDDTCNPNNSLPNAKVDHNNQHEMDK